MIDVSAAREQLSYLKSGKIYFNHASIGPLPDPVKKVLDDYLNTRNSGEIEDFQNLVDTTNRARVRVGKMLNASAKEIAFVDSVSNGINILANGIKWQKGDRILLNDLEFPSNVYPFLNLKKLGVEIDFVKNRQGKIYFEDIEAAVTDKTKLISVSMVQFLTGQKMPMESIGNLCKERGIIFSVDAIQAAGNSAIDVKKMNIDYLVGGAHKWLMALQGVTYVYLSPDLLKNLDQKFVGWTSVKDAWNLIDYNLDLREDASRFMNGTYNAIGVTALEASCKFFESFGYEEIERKIKQNSKYFLEELSRSSIKTILDLKSEKELSGIVSCRFDDPEKLFKYLKEKNIQCAKREDLIRFSPHFYNTEEEIDIVISALRKAGV